MPEREKKQSPVPDLTRLTPGSAVPTDDSRRSTGADEPTRVSGSSLRAAATAADAETPEIEGYEIHEKIHRGGQGIVFRATQRGAKRQVALKVILEGPYASESARRRFEREVELAASLRHPGIVTILDAGVSGGRYYYAMDFIEGARLSDYFKLHSPTLPTALGLLARICDAVNYAHQHGVIHRDLKPSNILVDGDGDPHVLDFGLAKAQRGADPDASTLPALSMTGQVLGTLAYMSPEQAAGAQDVDVRSDVYSLGVIAYELLLGRTPYPVDGPLGEVLTRIANDEPKPPRQARSSSRFGRLIDDELETILLKALDKDPNRRYQTAGDFGRDLRRYLRGEAIEAKRASGLYVLRKTLRRYRLHAVSAGVVLFLLVAFLIVFALQYRQERQLREQTEALRVVALDKARHAAEAEAREREARQSAENDRQRALAAAEERRRALVQQTIQSGDLALLRGDLTEARDCYWDAVADAPESSGALWALRQYYMQTDDIGCGQLTLHRYGPVALSPDGALAAACDAPSSITMREIASGTTLAWMATPGEPQTLSVSDSGLVAAAGASWARLWQIPASQPQSVIEFPREARPLGVYPLQDGRLLLVVDEAYVWLFRCADGALLAEQALQGTAAGTPVLSPAQAALAIPTSAGIEIAHLDGDGLKMDHIAPAGRTERPRAARFLDEDTLAVLSSEVYLISLADAKKMHWRLRIQIPENCEFFDLQGGGRVLALGTRDGRVELYRSTQLVKEWRVTPSRLEEIRLTPDGDALLTLDDEGAVTRWNAAPDDRHPPILSRSTAKWACSGDGRTVLLVDDAGVISVYAKETDVRTIPLEWSSLYRRLAGGTPEDVLISIDHDGRFAAIVVENRIWLTNLSTLRGMPIPRRNRDDGTITRVALSGDARTLAYCVHNELEQRDLIVFRSVADLTAAESEPRAARRAAPQSMEFVGGAVTAIAFAPGSTELLASRSSGEVYRLSTSEEDSVRSDRKRDLAAPEPWVILDAAAEQIAFDRNGTRAALACADGFVRLLDLIAGTDVRRIHFGKTINSVSFNAAGDMLLTCAEDGVIRLYDLGTFERVARWPSADPGRRPLALWFGPEDAILAADRAEIRAIDPARFDGVIDANRIYASQRRISRALIGYEYDDAWDQAARLADARPELARELRVHVLCELLRRPRAALPPDWLDAVSTERDAIAALQLGHAAYDGNRIELAYRYLSEAAYALDGRIDAYTNWRISDCLYLLDQTDQARERLMATVRLPDFDPHDLPHAALELLTACALTGRYGDFDDLQNLLKTSPRFLRFGDTAEMTAVQLIGRTLLESGARRGSSGQLQAVLSYLEGLSIPFRDKLEFIAGETARVRGEIDQAARRYQRCVDLARDDWPANWARYRLLQLPANP